MYKEAYYRTKILFSRIIKPFKKQELQKDKKNRYCCSQLREKSLLTGFAEITKSNRFLRKVIKLFVFCICTTGFFYHTVAFLQIYLAYPTMQDVSEEYPDSFSAPAITICNGNRFFRQRYCNTYPHLCTYPETTWEEFCVKYNRLCPRTHPFRFNFGIPNRFVNTLYNRSSTFLNAIGPQELWDLRRSCRYSSVSTNVPCSNSMMVEAVKNGLPYKCFSFNSLLGNQNNESIKLTYEDEFHLELEMKPEEYLNDNDLVQASVFIHDPRKVVNPLAEGLTLSAGKSYKLYVTMKEKKKSLPPPYASKCRDYLNEWKESGGYGPLSKKDCTELCKIKAMADEYGCVGQTITYPNNYTICENKRIAASPEMNRKCTSGCRDACEENIYHFTAEVVVGSQCVNQTDEHCKHSFLEIEVSFNRMIFQTLQQIPRFESIELFSYIGGYLGMWLGISLATLFDFLEVIYDVIAYLCLRGKKNQKTTTPVEAFRHLTV